MDSFDRLMAQAKELGLSGSEAGQYVSQLQAYEREERAAERQARKEEAERQARKEEAERQARKEEAERQAQARKEEAEREAREAEAVRQAQREEADRLERDADAERKAKLELARIAAETEQLRLSGQGKPDTLSIPEAAARPKLPAYQDGEDIATYLTRFERVAELLQLNKDTYAVRLGCLLTGKAAELYVSLSPEITSDYNRLKTSLLAGFKKTSDGYRLDFRSAKIRDGENYTQFSVHLTRLFQSWLEASKIEETFVSLKEFMVLDQFLASLSSDLRTFVKEHCPSSLARAVQLADDWTSAHPSSRSSVKQTPRPVKPTWKASPPVRSSSTPTTSSTVKCHGCGEIGHIRPRCPKNPRAFRESPPAQPFTVGFCLSEHRVPGPLVSGTVNGSWTSSIFRDSGCTCIVVANEVLPDADLTNCRHCQVADYLGRVDTFPVLHCYVRCPYFEGWTDVVRAPIKFASVLIGTVPGVRSPKEPYTTFSYGEQSPTSDVLKPPEQRFTKSAPDHPSSPTSSVPPQVCVVETRASTARMKRLHPLHLPDLQPLSVTPEEFGRLQMSCDTLTVARAKAAAGEIDQVRNNSTFQFLFQDGLLYRKCLTSQRPDKVGKLCLVVPRKCRPFVLNVAHENPVAGHYSHRKTEQKIADQFFWPGMGTDIRVHCRSCDKCQRFSQKGRVRPAPLQPMPIVTEPFARIAIDLVGPLSPPSSAGHKYILTLIDFSTGFPEALPLKDIDSISVAEALLTVFSRVGIPREVLSDRGTQFTSALMQELHRLLGVKPIFTTPYHPSGNGRIERLHGPLKAILRKLCSEKPREWHRYLTPTLFALRETPSDRTGFSPFELLYGRSVRGPLSVLRDLWEDKTLQEDERTSFQYVLELRDKLEECSKIAAQNAEVSRRLYKTYFDLKSQGRSFKPGDEVLVLLPSNTSKLLVSWNGPYRILQKKGTVDYLVDLPQGPKLLHVNILKQYHRRAQVQCVQVLDEVSTLEALSAPGKDGPTVTEDPDASEVFQLPPSPSSSEAPATEKPQVGESLTWDQRSNIEDLFEEFSDIFSNVPGHCTILEHDITLTTTDRVQAKVYPVPVHLQPYFRQEVDTLFQQGIIQRSSSPHCSPVVMVRKADNSYRMAIDYRQLNSITVFHAEPTCSITEDLHKFSGSKYFSELDLCKAYYQVPLTNRAKPLTAFPTHLGLMEFCRMPFGLSTACATYIRLMRILLAGLPNVSFYFDNIFVYSKDWTTHLEALRGVLQRMREHHLTIKPSKCCFGVPFIRYLGFIVDGTNLQPQHDKTEAITTLLPPTSKKLLKAFLGLVSFYLMFIPQAADYTGPLSDLLKKTVPEPLVWSEDLLMRFKHLKDTLVSPPVLRLPNPDLTFVLRTDASSRGIGAVLLQYYGECPHPVAYASRKLLDRETRYSTIERECLAVVFAINRFDFYLRGKEFILEVDHKPLLYLSTFKGKNDRLLRWALSLQAYKFRVVHIAGKDNLGADLLSRSC